MIARNTIEFHYERCDWRNVVEEQDFVEVQQFGSFHTQPPSASSSRSSSSSPSLAINDTRRYIHPAHLATTQNGRRNDVDLSTIKIHDHTMAPSSASSPKSTSSIAQRQFLMILSAQRQRMRVQQQQQQQRPHKHQQHQQQLQQ
jgi:hypothetical protein